MKEGLRDEAGEVIINAQRSAVSWIDRWLVKDKKDIKRGRQPRRRFSSRLWHSAVPGPLWNGTKVVNPRQIKAYCRALAREFHPHKIILFGSHAAGSATPESDVDLIIVMPFHGNSTNQVVKIRGRVEAPFPMDLLVWKPNRMRCRDSFTRTVLNEGRILYESRHSPVGQMRRRRL